MQLRNSVKRQWTRFKHNAWVRFADAVVSASTYEAARRLRKSGPITILVDNSTLAYGITHETAWISTGTKMWGHVPIETGHLARVPVHSNTNDSDTYREVTYIIGIAHLARKGLVQLVRSSELIAETRRQPTGRYTGYGWDDLNVFQGIDMPILDTRQIDVFAGVERESMGRLRSPFTR